MFIVLLRFTGDRARAATLMDGHKAWIRRGLDDGVFLLVGSLLPNLGGAILAHGIPRAALERRVSDDPFVAEQLVTPEILEIAPAQAGDRLKFLLG